MTTLLSSFDKPARRAFQLYEVVHGIERFSVKVPLEKAPTFEASFTNLKSKSKSKIIALVENLGGKVT